MGRKVQKRILVSAVCLFSLFLGSSLWAATFTVTTTSDNDCSDFQCDFQSALDVAALLPQDNTILLEGGTYTATGGPFVWAPKDNFTLAITGVGPVVISGEGTNRGLSMDTSSLYSSDTNAHMTLQNISFTAGTPATGQGGALYVRTNDANITIETCRFDGNTSESGGGAYLFSTSGGIITLKNNTFTGNASTGLGGGGVFAYSSSGSIGFEKNIFIQNSSSIHAGGAYAQSYSGDILLTDNVFTSNSSGERGGGASFVTTTGVVTLTNNTLTANLAGTFGGGVDISLNYNVAVANLYNNIVWNNEAFFTDGEDIYVCDDCTGAITGAEVNLYNNDFIQFYSTCQAGLACTPSVQERSNIAANPVFFDVSDPDPRNWNLQLGGGSPCIDTGNNEAVDLPPLDLAGNNRRIDGDQDKKVVVDMGAYEYIPSASAYDYVTLLSPNGRETIPRNSTFTIKWGAPLQAVKFTLLFSKDLGTTWKTIAKNLAAYSVDWVTPKVQGNKKKCLVKVEGYDINGNKVGHDVSSAKFAIEVVSVTYPNGGEVFQSGTTNTISWTAVPEAVTFNIAYSHTNGQSWIPIRNRVTGNSFDWIVPIPEKKNKKNCLVRVRALNANGAEIGQDASNDPFRIEVMRLISPNGGNLFTSGGDVTVVWTTNATRNQVNRVKLYLTKDGEQTWSEIETLMGNPKTYVWKVPPVSRTRKKCKLKVVLKDASGNTLAKDSSDFYFTIQP